MDRSTKRRKRFKDGTRSSTDSRSASLDEEGASGDPSTVASSTRRFRRKRKSTSKSNSTRQQNDEPLDLPDWYEPREQDIIFMRGKNVLNHPGNLRYHEVIHRYIEEYQSRTTRQEKTVLLHHIVQELRSNDGANLIKQNNDTGLWYDIGDASGRYKVGHCIRDFLKSGRESLRSDSANSSQSGTATETTTTAATTASAESSFQRPVAEAAARGEGKPRGNSQAVISQGPNDDKRPKKKRTTPSVPKRRRSGSSSHEGDVSRTTMKETTPATSRSQPSSLASSSQTARTEFSSNKPPPLHPTSSRQSPSIFSSTDFDFDGRNFAPTISVSGHRQNETLTSLNEEDQKPRARRSRRTDTDLAGMKMSASRPSNEQSSTYGRQYMSSISSTADTVIGATAAASSSNQTSILGNELFESARSNQPYGHGTSYGVGSFFQHQPRFPTMELRELPGAAAHGGFSFPFNNPAAQLPFHQQRLVTGQSYQRSNSMPTVFNEINPSVGGIPGRTSSTNMAELSQIPGSLIGRGALSTTTSQDTSDPSRQGEGGILTQLLSQAPQLQRYSGVFPGTTFPVPPPAGYGRSSSDSMLMSTSSGLSLVDDSSSLSVMVASEAVSRDRSLPRSRTLYGSGIRVDDSTNDPIEPRPIEEMIEGSQVYPSASLNVQGGTTELTDIRSLRVVDRALASSNPSPQDGQESHDDGSGNRGGRDDAGSILPSDWM